MISNKNIVGPSIKEGDIISFTLKEHNLYLSLTENLYPERNRVSKQNIQDIPASEWFENDLRKSVELLSYEWKYGWGDQTIWIGTFHTDVRFIEHKSNDTNFLDNTEFCAFIVEELKRRAINSSFFPEDEDKSYADFQIPLSTEAVEVIPTNNACLTQSGDINIGLPDLHAYIPINNHTYIKLDFSFGKLGNDHLPTYPLTDEELQSFKREVMMEILDGIKITPN